MPAEGKDSGALTHQTVDPVITDRSDRPAKPLVSVTLSPSQLEEILRTVEASGFAALITDILSRIEVPVHTDSTRSRSLLRGLAIIACFGPTDEALGLMEIAERVRLNASTITRYVNTLMDIGLLERSQETRKYSLPLTAPIPNLITPGEHPKSKG